MTLPDVTGIPYGGDYNPEQWPRGGVGRRLRRVRRSPRIDTVTARRLHLGADPARRDVYDFSTLDRIVDRATAEGRAHLPGHRHRRASRRGWRGRIPEVTRTDFEGRRHRYGQRHNSCPSSPAFRRLSAELARRIAAALRRQPGGRRVARRQRVRRRLLLRPVRARRSATGCAQRYATLDALNAAWYTTFWSHTLHRLGRDRAAVGAHRALARPGPHRVPGHHAGLPAVHVRRDAGQLPRREGGDPRVQPDLPVTTNFMGMYRPHRLPPLGAAPRLRLVGQLPARRHVAGRGWR